MLRLRHVFCWAIDDKVFVTPVFERDIFIIIDRFLAVLVYAIHWTCLMAEDGNWDLLGCLDLRIFSRQHSTNLLLLDRVLFNFVINLLFIRSLAQLICNGASFAYNVISSRKSC